MSVRDITRFSVSSRGSASTDVGIKVGGFIFQWLSVTEMVAQPCRIVLTLHVAPLGRVDGIELSDWTPGLSWRLPQLLVNMRARLSLSLSPSL